MKAKMLGGGWDRYLAGLLDVVHYAEHAEADVSDAHGAFGNVFAVVTADGRVSARELKRLLAAGAELYAALKPVYEQAGQVALDRTVLRRLSLETWSDALEEFKLPPPTEQNANEWLRVIDGWVGAATSALSGLRLAALDQLLLAERQVAKFVREGMTPAAAPEPSRVPAAYSVLLPGSERARQKRLGLWDRFQVADGFGATAARLAVASAIIVAVVGVGGMIGEATLDIHNGLDRPVKVVVGAQTVELRALSTAQIVLPRVASHSVETTSLDGQLIEAFEAETARSFAHFVYNVAGAAPLVEWTAVYGDARDTPERHLGSVRWTTTTADDVFEEPPRSISTSGEGGTRRVLSAPSDASPSVLLALANSDAEREQLVATHARWDSANSRGLEGWLALAAELPDFGAIMRARLEHDPHDIMTLRMEQHAAAGDEHAAVCARHSALAAAQPDDGDFRYLATRCIEDSAGQRRAFLDAFAAHPDNGWLAYAVGYDYAAHARWDDAVAPLELARRKVPGLAEAAATMLARIRRLTMGEEAAWSDLTSDSAMLKYFADIEIGGELPPSDEAYRHLYRGELEAAVANASGTPIAARVLRLAAASDGASPELGAKLRTLPAAEGFDAAIQFATFGLALRAGQRIDADAISGLAPQAIDIVVRFAEALLAGDHTTAAERTLDGAEVSLRGYAYSMATIALGERTPPEWREGARRLLFATERPFFAPADAGDVDRRAPRAAR